MHLCSLYCCDNLFYLVYVQYQAGLAIHHQALLEGQQKERFQVNIVFLVQDFKVLGKILLLAKVGSKVRLYFLLGSFKGQLQIFHRFIKLGKAVLELFLRESLMMELLLLSSVQER